MARGDFITQLRELGYEVEDRGDGKLVFQHTIEVGRLAGQEILLGFQVGEDFPMNPPSGPHVSPRLLPINTNNDPHPKGGVHESAGFGADWQYWSRPFPNWQSTDRTVRTYMAHIRHLFATA